MCSPGCAGTSGTAGGVRLKRGAGAGCGKPATSTNVWRCTMCGWRVASSIESTGAKQTSEPSISAHHSSRVFVRKIFARRSFIAGHSSRAFCPGSSSPARPVFSSSSA